MSDYKTNLFDLIKNALPVKFWRDIEDAQLNADQEAKSLTNGNLNLHPASRKRLEGTLRYVFTDDFIGKQAEKAGANVRVEITEQGGFPYFIIETPQIDFTIKSTQEADELPKESLHRKQMAKVNRQTDLPLEEASGEQEIKVYGIVTHCVSKEDTDGNTIHPGHLTVGIPTDDYRDWYYFPVSTIIDALKEQEIIEVEPEHMGDKATPTPKEKPNMKKKD